MANRERQNPEHHEPQNPNLDPQSDHDADLEAGGGVKPGHTPPDSQSATDTPQHAPPTRPPRSKLTVTLMIVLALLLVFVFVAYGIGLWD